MKKSVLFWGCMAAILLFLLIIPYLKVEILTINAEEKLEAFDISCFDNIYCEGTPRVYDRKIYSYQEKKNAKVLYVLGDCEFGVMVNLVWNDHDNCWDLADTRNVWTVHGGSAQEWYWPIYYVDKLF